MTSSCRVIISLAYVFFAYLSLMIQNITIWKPMKFSICADWIENVTDVIVCHIDVVSMKSFSLLRHNNINTQQYVLKWLMFRLIFSLNVKDLEYSRRTSFIWYPSTWRLHVIHRKCITYLPFITLRRYSTTRARFHIKTVFVGTNPHNKFKTNSWPFYPYDGYFYTGKTANRNGPHT